MLDTLTPDGKRIATRTADGKKIPHFLDYVLPRVEEYASLGAKKAQAFGHVEVERTGTHGLQHVVGKNRNKASLAKVGVDLSVKVPGIWDPTDAGCYDDNAHFNAKGKRTEDKNGEIDGALAD